MKPQGRTMYARLAAAVIAAAAVGVVHPPAAHADAPPACLTAWDGSSAVCDGPIRPDGTFKRCWGSRAYVSGSLLYSIVIPRMVHCEDVDPSQPWPLIPVGAPQHHIEVGDTS